MFPIQTKVEFCLLVTVKPGFLFIDHSLECSYSCSPCSYICDLSRKKGCYGNCEKYRPWSACAVLAG